MEIGLWQLCRTAQIVADYRADMPQSGVASSDCPQKVNSVAAMLKVAEISSDVPKLC